MAKEALFDGFAEVAKALANGRRAELIDVLAQGERHVDELADELGHSVANTSFHLRTLAAAGLTRTRRDGTRIYYRLASPLVEELWATLRNVAATHYDQIEELAAAYLGNRDTLETITLEELNDRLASDNIIVIDVRPVAEYRAGHITGARSVPIDQLSRHLRALPTDAEIVAYCRGPYCVLADDAVRALRKKGRHAKRLEYGYPEWRDAKLPTSADQQNAGANEFDRTLKTRTS